MIVVYSLEAVDRSLYEVIRLKLVQLGYMPDVRVIKTQAEIKKQEDIIKTNLGYNVKLYGVGTAESRGTKDVVTISIDRKAIRPSGLGNKQFVYKKKDNGKYDKLSQPIHSSDVEYEIRLFTNSVAKERIFEMLFLDIFGYASYIPVEKSYREYDSEMFIVVNNGSVDVSSTDIREKILNYTISDVWVGVEHLQAEVVPVTSIKTSFKIKRANGELDSEKEIITTK